MPGTLAKMAKMKLKTTNTKVGICFQEEEVHVS